MNIERTKKINCDIMEMAENHLWQKGYTEAYWQIFSQSLDNMEHIDKHIKMSQELGPNFNSVALLDETGISESENWMDALNAKYEAFMEKKKTAGDAEAEMRAFFTELNMIIQSMKKATTEMSEITTIRECMREIYNKL